MRQEVDIKCDSASAKKFFSVLIAAAGDKPEFAAALQDVFRDDAFPFSMGWSGLSVDVTPNQQLADLMAAHGVSP